MLNIFVRSKERERERDGADNNKAEACSEHRMSFVAAAADDHYHTEEFRGKLNCWHRRRRKKETCGDTLVWFDFVNSPVILVMNECFFLFLWNMEQPN